MRIYQAASGPVRGQFWMTVGLGVYLLGVGVRAQALREVEAHGLGSLVTLQNFSAAVVFAYGVGMTVSNFREYAKQIRELKGRVDSLEGALAALKLDALERYVQHGTCDERMGRRSTDPVLKGRHS